MMELEGRRIFAGIFLGIFLLIGFTRGEGMLISALLSNEMMIFW